MIALVLAAGTGARLLPVTKDIPKTLIKIQGRTMLDHIIANLSDVGIIYTVVATGHGRISLASETIRLSRKYDNRIHIVENLKYKSTNTGYSLLLCLNSISDSDDVVIINGDLLFDKRILKRLLLHRRSTIVVDSTRNLTEESFKIVLSKGQIISMGKSVDICRADGEFIGISLVRKKDLRLFTKCLEKIVSHNPMEYYDLAFMEMSKKKRIEIEHTRDLKWIEVDFPADLDSAIKLVNNLELAE